MSKYYAIETVVNRPEREETLLSLKLPNVTFEEVPDSGWNSLKVFRCILQDWDLFTIDNDLKKLLKAGFTVRFYPL
jgi:hypothetical protein